MMDREYVFVIGKVCNLACTTGNYSERCPPNQNGKLLEWKVRSSIKAPKHANIMLIKSNIFGLLFFTKQQNLKSVHFKTNIVFRA